MGKKTGNPLGIRVLRELRGEWKKYAVIFIFLTLMIGFVSGMYVANNSMLIATDRVKTEELREDGHFVLKEKADKDLIEDIETGDKVDVRAYYVWDSYGDITEEEYREAFRSGNYKERLQELYDEADRRAAEDYENAVGDYDLDDPYFRPVPVRVFENFNKEADEDIDSDGTRDSGIRVYINRDNIDLYCIMDGRPAETADEIMIDRMHADNRGIKTGDRISVNGEEFTVSGLAAFSNYATLHEKNTDMMFDALTFDVAMTTEEGWDRINAETRYEYAWLYENRPADVKEEKKQSDNFLKALITQAAFADNEIVVFNLSPTRTGPIWTVCCHGIRPQADIGVKFAIDAVSYDSTLDKQVHARGLALIEGTLVTAGGLIVVAVDDEVEVVGGDGFISRVVKLQIHEHIILVAIDLHEFEV